MHCLVPGEKEATSATQEGGIPIWMSWQSTSASCLFCLSELQMRLPCELSPKKFVGREIQEEKGGEKGRKATVQSGGRRERKSWRVTVSNLQRDFEAPGYKTSALLGLKNAQIYEVWQRGGKKYPHFSLNLSKKMWLTFKRGSVELRLFPPLHLLLPQPPPPFGIPTSGSNPG